MLEQCHVEGDIVASRILWDNEPVAITANEALAAEAAGTESRIQGLGCRPDSGHAVRTVSRVDNPDLDAVKLIAAEGVHLVGEVVLQ